jgi:hypothetical protein
VDEVANVNQSLIKEFEDFFRQNDDSGESQADEDNPIDQFEDFFGQVDFNSDQETGESSPLYRKSWTEALPGCR